VEVENLFEVCAGDGDALLKLLEYWEGVENELVAVYELDTGGV